MKPNELYAYDHFMHTGKIEDYIKYINARHTADSTYNAVITGETIAYQNERDRAKRTTNQGIR